MAKSKVSTPKTKKPRATKYTKLALVCSKELAAKKKALVQAEKRLAKAQQAHSELLSEVARLDMLDRSLRSVNEKTAPPQNITYVYTYPQWVWQPGYTYQNPPTWHFTNVPNFQGGQTGLTGYNSGGLPNSGSLLTYNGGGTSWAGDGNITLTTTLANTNVDNSSVFTLATPASGLGATCNAGFATTTTTGSSGSTLTVDLTTNAPFEDTLDDRIEKFVENQGKLVEQMVGHNG